ncbi:DUF2332 domain-containing protein [Sphingomonas sp.]|uniref:DUF2332 domain-containing protein n=2 Tax=Sphingomonas TaxID=13687 RepID=UPI0018E52EDF|nr:DUF2332 family protein [Sphingomonas sp.]
MPDDHTAPGPLTRQAAAVRMMGSPFVARVLEASARQLHRAPRTAALFAAWPRDAASDALAMRLNAALHALALRGTLPALTAFYAAQGGDADRVIGDALAATDAFIADWMRETPQTNEVGRAAAIMAALMTLRGQYDMPCELRELGCSAGLNLNLARYAYDLGGVAAGDPASPVRIAPDWRGVPVAPRAVDIASARGVDLHPLDARDDTACERLMAHVWADQPDRAERLARALAIARAAPPAVDRGDIAGWLPGQLAAPQRDGLCRVVVHSMALQYLEAGDRRIVEDLIATHGRYATATRPFARIAFEWTPARDAVHLTLTAWPDGRVHHLAICHAYGAWIDWHGADTNTR